MEGMLFTPRVSRTVRLRLEIEPTTVRPRGERYTVKTTDGHTFKIRRAACGAGCRCDAILYACVGVSTRKPLNEREEKYFALATRWRDTLPNDDPRRQSTVVTRPNSDASRAFLDKWQEEH